MAARMNHLGQPIGEPLPDWRPPPFPPQEPLEGRYCRVEPLAVAAHCASLYEANARASDDRSWTYLPYGPFPDEESYRVWMEGACRGTDPLFHAIIDQRTQKTVGVASYLRIAPPVGVIEVGHLAYSPLLQRTPAATEAMFVMADRAFALGYRRYEWKCDALNEPSRAAARRLGFTFEGLFRQATIYKGRTRDTAWYAIIDRDWPALRAVYQRWLDPANFDAEGRQRTSLSGLTRPLSQPLVELSDPAF